MEQYNYFKGVALNEKQRNALKNNIRSVMGEEYYKLAYNFFGAALNFKAQYIVFLARRCFNLVNLLYRSHFDKPNQRFEQCVLSDSGLLAMIPTIAKEYMNYGSMPSILIADDILIHGRAINTLMDTYISSLSDYLSSNGFEVSDKVLEKDVLKSVTIKTMVQNNKPLLMKGEYYQRFIADGFNSNIWHPKQWHELSSRISRLISESIFSNTGFTLSLYDNADAEHESDVKSFPAIIENAARSLGFIKSGWNKRLISDAWVKPLKRSNGDIVAFYTLRITQNSVDNKFCAVPFVIAADMNISQSKKLINWLFGKGSDKYIFGSLYTHKVSAEFLYLVLSYNLLLLIQERSGDKDLISPQNLDVDKILLNFGKETWHSRAIESLLKFKKPFLNWDKMDDWLLNATESSEPLIKSNITHTTIKYQNISDALDETIADEGEEIEMEAFLEYSGQKKPSAIAERKPIRNLFLPIENLTHIQDVNDDAVLVGDFLRHMDRGCVSVGARLRECKNSEKVISCEYRAGEQSQFIRPKKYADYLPVLIEMEKDCVYDCEQIIERINHVYEDNPKIRAKLEEYTKKLYASGQKFSDWDINWFNWIEIDDTTMRAFPNRNQKELLITQMILKSLNKSKAITHYRQLYPKN